MGELSESLKNVSLGSILVVVGIISILTMVIYWYVFSEDPVVPYVTSVQSSSQVPATSAPIPSSPVGDEVKSEPDDRVVIVETPSSAGGTATAEAVLPPGNKPGLNSTSQAAVPAASGTMSIQAGAFSKREGAEKLASQLKSKGFTSSVNSSGGMFRVFVGNYSSRKQAEDMVGSLKASGFSGYIKTIP